jgi:hypothetical protein
VKNPDDDSLLTYELQPQPPKQDVRLVWLLNLIPFTGAGYFYAVGFRRAIKLMAFFWIFMWIFGVGTIAWIYFILSVLGTEHILKKRLANRDGAAIKFQRVSLDDLQQVPRGRQVPLKDSPELAAASLMNKVQQTKRKIKSLSPDDDDNSGRAIEAFEYKAQAAERQLQARAAAEAKVVHAQVAPEPDAVLPGSNSTDSQHDFGSNASDYVTQVSNAYSVEAEVARITSGVSRGTAAETVAVNKSVAQETFSVTSSLPVQSPDTVPNVDAVLVDSNQFVPDVGSLLANSDQATPDVASMLVDSTQCAPDVSSQLVDSTQATPDVNSQLFDSTQAAPDVSSQLFNSTQATPDVSSQLFDSTQVAPDVSSQLFDSTQAAPDVSSQLVDSTQSTPEASSQLFNSSQMTPEVNSKLLDSTQPTPEAPQSPSISLGNFELPTFSFSFEDHMATPSASESAGGATTKSEPCPKCGVARDANFSFCLACGESFL